MRVRARLTCGWFGSLQENGEANQGIKKATSLIGLQTGSQHASSATKRLLLCVFTPHFSLVNHTRLSVANDRQTDRPGAEQRVCT